MGIKVKVGDVFLIPIKGEEWVGGQLLANRMKELYVAVYPKLVKKGETSVEDIIQQEPLFLALTLDAKLWHGHWPIIGNTKKNIHTLPQPFFKWDSQKGTMIESRDQRVRRLAKAHEIPYLKYRTVVAPIILENAAKAHFGIGNWDYDYDDLKAEYAYETSKFRRGY